MTVAPELARPKVAAPDTLARAARTRLTADDVWRLWCDEEVRNGREPIAKRTVHANIAHSWPAAPGQPPNRYERNPMPLPKYPHPDRPRVGQRPFWEPWPGETIGQLEQRLRVWWSTARAGRTGPAVDCPCGSGVRVRPTGRCGQCIYDLTRRERDLCNGLLEGLSIKEIAARFSIKRVTVVNRLSEVYSKVGVRSQIELIAKLFDEPLEAARRRRSSELG